MSKISLPTSDAERLAFLEQALTAAQEAANALLPTETIQRIGPQTSAFVAARNALIEAKAGQREATSEANQTVRMLNEYIHQIWQAVQVQVRWQQLSPTVLTYYQLQVDGSGPSRSANANWVDIANRLLTGAQRATAAGFTVNVDITPLQQTSDLAQAALTAVTVTRNNLVRAQQEVHTERRAIVKLIRHILSDLRYALRDESPVQRRQHMRAYGVRFEYDSSEAGDVVMPVSAD